MTNHIETLHAERRVIRDRALKLSSRIALVDGADERVIQAAKYVSRNGSVRPILIGDETSVRRRLRDNDADGCAEVVEPARAIMNENLLELYRRKLRDRGKPVPEDQVLVERLKSNSYCGAAMLESGEADGLLGGSSLPTAEILRASLDLVGLAGDSAIISGNFGIFLPSALPSGQNNLVFADCAVVPDPDSEQLAAIAMNAVKVAQKVLDVDPRVAFLSFSTSGSAAHPMVDRITRARDILRERLPEAVIDGEIQADAALIPDVARRKAPISLVGGKANVLIFPDLNSGNIAYKLVERLAGATAVGVILEGFRKPVNDLSRGCSVEDVIDMICVTALQAERPNPSIPAPVNPLNACAEIAHRGAEDKKEDLPK